MKIAWAAIAAAATLATVLPSGTTSFANHSTAAAHVVSASRTQSSPSDKILADMPSKRAEMTFSAYVTGYSFWDNAPPRSAEISKPVIHNRAGGTGHFNNPNTIAVGHTIIGSRQTLDFKPGTKFYIMRLRNYAIVEDVCGDGRKPQEGPCHSGNNGRSWLDRYAGGRKSTAALLTECARRITALQLITINLKPDYPVELGRSSARAARCFRSGHNSDVSTNANQSLFPKPSPLSGDAQLTPLGQSGAAVELDIGPAVEMSFLIEMIVDGGMSELRELLCDIGGDEAIWAQCGLPLHLVPMAAVRTRPSFTPTDGCVRLRTVKPTVLG